MALIPVSKLIRPLTRDDVLKDLIVLGDSLGLRASSWRVGSIARFFLLALAEMGSRVSVLISASAALFYNGTAWGLALTKLSNSTFDNQRGGAVRARGTLTLTDVGSVGPVVIGAGERTFPYTEDPTIVFRNLSGATVPLNGSVTIEVEAEVAGEAPNEIAPYYVDGAGEHGLIQMSPVIAGVRVRNDADPWLTRDGANAESDESLKLRNTSKWATLGGNAPREAYQYWALSAVYEAPGHPLFGQPVGITKVRVDDNNPSGPGTLTIYIAESEGTAPPDKVAAVQLYIDNRCPLTAVPTVQAATELTVTVTGTFRAPLATALEADVEKAVRDFINSLPIGGEDTGEGAGYVVPSELIGVVHGVDPSISKTEPVLAPLVNPSVPSLGVQLGFGEVAKPVVDLTPVVTA